MLSNKTFKIKGMHCASCSAIIESRVKKMKGVEKLEVNFATEKAKIKIDLDKINLEKINEEIGKLGYEFS